MQLKWKWLNIYILFSKLCVFTFLYSVSITSLFTLIPSTWGTTYNSTHLIKRQHTFSAQGIVHRRIRLWTTLAVLVRTILWHQWAYERRIQDLSPLAPKPVRLRVWSANHRANARAKDKAKVNTVHHPNRIQPTLYGWCQCGTHGV